MSSDARPERPATAFEYELDPPAETRLGISFSGGGIRSATFSLGAYQSLAERGIFGRARFLSAVSGGCYLASGVAISHAMSSPDTDEPAPWSRGSPEESRLRRNLSYLAPGGQGRLWLGANLLYGLLLNLTPIVLGAFIAGRATGLVLRPLSFNAEQPEVHLTAILGFALALVLAALTVVGARRFLDKTEIPHDSRRRTIASERTVTVLFAAAAGVTTLGVVVPEIILALPQDTSHGPDHLMRHHMEVAAIAGLAAIAIGALAVWLLRHRLLRPVQGALGALAGGSVILIPFILAAETAVVRPPDAEDLELCLVAGAVMLAFAILAHNRRYSMHLFYRERIQDAFASRRARRPGGPDGDGAVEAQPIRYAEWIMLSDVAQRLAERRSEAGFSHPELVICAAVAARGTEVPSQAWAASFTFEGERSGNRSLGLRAATKDVESGGWIGGGGITLPSMMAISGAALSPVMGRFTLPAFRFLMAMLNIRLGVWVRNPRRPRPQRAQPRTIAGKVWRYVVRGWEEPGAWYVMKEALGLASIHGKYVYVSDGGHWENLGLTELLRRRCSHILVVDASGDTGLGDIARAISVARAELGVEVHLDPRLTSPRDGSLADSPVAVGSYVYPDGDRGEIYFARCVLWKDAPIDLQMLAERERRFPNHSTGNQFLSGELFDAYRALGWAVAEQVAGKMHLPPPSHDEPAPTATPPGSSRAGAYPRRSARTRDETGRPRRAARGGVSP